MWDRKNAKYKEHLPHKKEKSTKIKESYICIECSKVSIKDKCEEKYTPLCREDNSSVKRHEEKWHKGSNSSTCTIISSSAPEIITLGKQCKDQQPIVLDEDNDVANTITTQEMLLETAVPVIEDDSRSDTDYYDDKSTFTNSSRLSTYSVTIMDSSDKLNKIRRLWCFSNKHKVSKSQI